MKNDKKSFTFLRLTIGVGLLVFLFYQIDFIGAIKLFNRINYLILIPILLYLPALWISMIRLNFFLDNKINFYKLLKTYWISSFFSNFLPGNVAGDSYKVIVFRKQIGTKEILKGVIFDRFSGLTAMLFVASILSFLVFNITKNVYFILIPILLFIVTILAIFSPLHSYLIKIKSVEFLKRYIDEFKDKFVLSSILSIIFFVLGAISLWSYYYMFGYNVDFLLVLAFYSAIQIVNSIPISINGWGLREGSIIYLFSLILIPFEVSLSIALLSRMVMLLQTSIGGLIYLFEK